MKSIKSYSRLLLILSGLTACAAGFFLFYHDNTGESIALFFLSIILMTVVFLMTGYEIYSAMHNDSLDQSQIEQSNTSQMEIITEKDNAEPDLTFSDDPDESKKTGTGSVSVEIIHEEDMSNNSDSDDTNDQHPESLEVSSVDTQSELQTEETPSIESLTEEDQDSETDLDKVPASILPAVSTLKSKNPLKRLLGNNKKHNLNNVYYGDWIELEDSYGIFSDLKEIYVENRQTNISKLIGGEVLKYDFYIWEGHPAVHLLNNKESLGVLPKALSYQLCELKDHIDRISVKNIRHAKVKQISVNISLNLTAKTKLIEMFGDQVPESTMKPK